MSFDVERAAEPTSTDASHRRSSSRSAGPLVTTDMRVRQAAGGSSAAARGSYLQE